MAYCFASVLPFDIFCHFFGDSIMDVRSVQQWMKHLAGMSLICLTVINQKLPPKNALCKELMLLSQKTE
jgi:hypothetical protein